jgi:hypothetical protein
VVAVPVHRQMTRQSRSDVPDFGSFLGSSRVLEPVHHVVDVQRLATPSGLETVQFFDVLLDLLTAGMLILGEPSLQLGQFQFWIETGTHSSFLSRKLVVNRLHGGMSGF